MLTVYLTLKNTVEKSLGLEFAFTYQKFTGANGRHIMKKISKEIIILN